MSTMFVIDKRRRRRRCTKHKHNHLWERRVFGGGPCSGRPASGDFSSQSLLGLELGKRILRLHESGKGGRRWRWTSSTDTGVRGTTPSSITTSVTIISIVFVVVVIVVVSSNVNERSLAPPTDLGATIVEDSRCGDSIWL